MATEVRLGGDDLQTRFVMDLSRKIDLHAFTLADPYRVVIDIPEVTFQLAPKAGETGRGLIKAFRYGLMMPGGSRLVFDLTKPVRIDKAFVVDPTEGVPARMVLELAPTDRESFLKKIALESKAAPADRAVFRRVRGQQERHAPAGGAGSRPRRPRYRNQGPAGELEKDIVLDFAQRLRGRIDALLSIRRG